MTERLQGLTIGLDMETAGIDRSLSEVKRSFKGLNSSIRTNANNLRFGEKSIENYEKNVNSLTGDIEKQQKNLSDIGKQYEQAVQQDGENARSTQRLAEEYNKQADNLNRLEHQLGNYADELANMKREQEITTSGWYKTGDALESFGDKLGGISSKARDLGGTLTKSITLPAMGVATALGGITAAFGWERLVGVDSARAQLQGLGYDAQEVERISEQVTDAIEGGMTTMAEGTATAAGALAAGVEEGEELERYIKLVGDAAVGANRPVEDMAQIFNRVQGNGKLMTKELNMIEQSMPGFAQAMADNLGANTQEEFREMVTAGEVGSDDFLNVMNDFAGDMASAYADSWQGMLANTKAYIGIIGESLLGGVFEESKESISEFIEFLQTDEVMDWAKTTGESIGQAFSKVADSIRSVIGWFSNLDENQQKTIMKVGAFIVALGPLLTGLGIFGGILAKISSGLGVFFKWLAPILTPLTKIGGAAASTGGKVGLLSRAFTFLTGPVGIVIGIVTTLASVFTLAYKKSETFRNFVHDLGSTLKDTFFSIVEFLRPAIEEVINFIDGIRQKIVRFMQEEGPQLKEAFMNIAEIIGTVIGWLWQHIQDTFNDIKAIIEFVMPFIVEIIKSTWDIITNTFSGALDIIMGAVQIFSGIFTADFSKMWEGVKTIFMGAIKIVWSLIKNTFIGRIIQAIIDFVMDFRENISNMWERVKSLFIDFIQYLVNRIRNSFVVKVIRSVIKLKNDFIELAGDMWQGVKDKFNDIVDGAKALPGRIGRAIKSAKSKATNGMKNVGNALIRTAGKPFNKVVDGVNWITGKFAPGRTSIKHWNYPQYAKGTKGHPGGGAILGDGKGSNAGSELVTTPSGKSFMSESRPTLYPNLPKGTQVMPARLTKQLPHYAEGTGLWDGIKDVFGYITNPTKLIGKVMDKIKVDKGLAQIPKDVTKAGIDYLKKQPVEYLKGIIKDAGAGGGGKPNFGYPVTSPFGYRIHPITGARKLHAGVDFGFPHGTNVPAQTGGTVGTAGTLGGYGKTVSIKNGVMEFLYAHLSKILTRSGASVSKGDIIAKSGNTGASTGPHLHYEARKNGKPVDPMKLSAQSLAGTGVDKWRDVARRALSMTGQLTPGNLDKLLFQMKTESNGNPKAINNWDINAKRGTPSKGLMQVIDPTFQAHKMAGHNDIWNPLDNMLASIRYAVSRYGSLSSAYRGVGYATGGLINKEGLYPIAEDGHPEWIIPTDPKRRTDAMKLLALAGKDIQGNKRPSSLPNVRSNDNGKLEDVVDYLAQQVDLLTQILAKDNEIAIDGMLVARATHPHLENINDRSAKRSQRNRGD